MFLNGSSLLRQPLRERLRLLAENFTAVPGRFSEVRRVSGTAGPEGMEEVAGALQSALEEGAEGLMVKLLDNPPGEQKKGAMVATYEADKRTDSWMKVKKDYSEGFGTWDFVVLGAWWGNGRKKGESILHVVPVGLC
jgi:DNA ligase-1